VIERLQAIYTLHLSSRLLFFYRDNSTRIRPGIRPGIGLIWLGTPTPPSEAIDPIDGFHEVISVNLALIPSPSRSPLRGLAHPTYENDLAGSGFFENIFDQKLDT